MKALVRLLPWRLAILSRILQPVLTCNATRHSLTIVLVVQVFVEYVSKCRAAGITCPILPGIMPIQVKPMSRHTHAHLTPYPRLGPTTPPSAHLVTPMLTTPLPFDFLLFSRPPPFPPFSTQQSYMSFKRMTAFCRSRVPQSMWDELAPIKDDDEAVKHWGVQYLTQMCKCVGPGLRSVDIASTVCLPCLHPWVFVLVSSHVMLLCI